MGIWGVNNFDNDEALDWVYDLEEAQDLSLAAESLRSVAELDHGTYLEHMDCAAALAAAEVLAALRGKPGQGLPPEVVTWIQMHADQNTAPYIPLAIAAIRRIRTDSESRELWEETDYFADWFAVLEGLEKRLTGR